MRVTLTLGDRSTNDPGGQQGEREQRRSNDLGESAPIPEEEPESTPQLRTGEGTASTDKQGSQTLDSVSQNESSKSGSRGRLKTTGLEKPEGNKPIYDSLPPPPRASRKRRATSSLDSQDKKPLSQRDTKRKDGRPFSKMVSGGSNNARRIASGTNSEDENIERRLYSVRHIDDDVRQDPEDEDPVEDLPEIMPAENNPESARGDLVNSTIRPCSQAASQETETEPNSDSRSVVASKGATNASTLEEQIKFVTALKKRGLEILEQYGDGNCLFRAISLQVYGDAAMHSDVRKKCMDFMERDREHFSMFVTGEPFMDYIARKRQDGVHGNNPEIQAISELFNRPIEVFTPDNGATPLNIFHAEYKTDDAPIRLSYHDGNHYNAVIDPLVPTAGLGLGLPGLQPGLADKMQVAKAVAESDAAADTMELQRALKQSEDDEIQRKMKESEDDELQRAIKLSRMTANSIHGDRATRLSDMDATYEQLEQAALEESLRYVGQGEKKKASTKSSEQEMRDDGGAAAITSPRVDSHESYAGGSVAMGAASMPASASLPGNASSTPLRPVEEYSSTVQELVMNGFELRAVLKAYDLVGDSFDDILSLLLANVP